MNGSNLNYKSSSRKQNDSGIYGNVRECILLFENGSQKIISNNNIKGQLTVNVLTHLTKENTFVESVLNH